MQRRAELVLERSELGAEQDRAGLEDARRGVDERVPEAAVPPPQVDEGDHDRST